MKIVAPVHSVVYRSPSPQDVFPYSPGIASLPNGRLIATIDLGGAGVGEKVEGPKGIRYGRPSQGIAFISDDGGDSWKEVAKFPFLQCRPFVAGNSLYILGHCEDLMVMRSDDNGETWGPISKLTDGQDWHQAPCNVWYSGDNVYLVMEHR